MAGGWVQVDFGSTCVLDRVALYGGYAYFNPFTLLASTHGSNFAAIGHLPATPTVDPPGGGTGTPVPVPGTEALLLVGLASLGALRRRTRGQGPA